METKPKIKTLASCNPREFLVQTNKIRKKASDWLSKTRILEIRAKQPTLDIHMNMEERKNAMREQTKANLGEMLDAILEDYPNETAELLGLMCFIEPEDLDNYEMANLLGCAAELLGNQDVIDFFTSLALWERIDTSTTARA